jgi:hypothetical protein
MRKSKGGNMRIVTLAVAVMVLTGCVAPQFTVKEADTRFTENKNPLYLAENNRISTKSVAGGIHIDGKGVYLNPFVEKIRGTGQVMLLGFNIVNLTDYTTTAGGVNQLGLIREMVFRLSDGQLITLKVTNQENRSSDTISYNTIARYASYDKWETGVVEISKDAFEKLAFTDRLSCKISGSKQSVVYEEKDIAPTFLPNLRQFYVQYVK